jgi:hypothetical protein
MVSIAVLMDQYITMVGAASREVEVLGRLSLQVIALPRLISLFKDGTNASTFDRAKAADRKTAVKRTIVKGIDACRPHLELY